MAISVFRETHFRKEFITYFSFYSKHNILSDSAFFRWLSFSSQWHRVSWATATDQRWEHTLEGSRAHQGAQSAWHCQSHAAKEKKNTANQGHTLNISMECMIASAASIIPWSDDFQWFLIQKVNCEAVVVLRESFVISLLQFSFQQSQVYRALSLSRVLPFSFFARCIVLHLVLAQPWR